MTNNNFHEIYKIFQEVPSFPKESYHLNYIDEDFMLAWSEHPADH